MGLCNSVNDEPRLRKRQSRVERSFERGHDGNMLSFSEEGISEGNKSHYSCTHVKVVKKMNNAKLEDHDLGSNEVLALTEDTVQHKYDSHDNVEQYTEQK